MTLCLWSHIWAAGWGRGRGGAGPARSTHSLHAHVRDMRHACSLQAIVGGNLEVYDNEQLASRPAHPRPRLLRCHFWLVDTHQHCGTVALWH